jgi:hypothetical protein
MEVLMKNIRVLPCVLFTFVSLFLLGPVYGNSESEENIPVATKWLLDAVGPSGRNAVKYAFLIYGSKTQIKGTGFQIQTGHIVTNEHVIRGNEASQIIVTSSYGERVRIKRCITDGTRDLAILEPEKLEGGGFDLGKSEDLKVGVSVSTWGYPYGYNGPAPLLTVGYLSGFNAHIDEKEKRPIKHLVVNSAFNPGNSGGPLFVSQDDKVIGIVVSKYKLVDPFIQSVIRSLSNPPGGIGGYAVSDGEGNKETLLEPQLVARVLERFRELTQVVIGEAIDVAELKALMKERGIYK